MRVLLIDDSLIDAHITRAALEQFDDAVIVEQHEASAAIALAEQFMAELVMLDWNMPGADNHELITALRDRTGQAPVIVTAHEADRPDMIGALKSGASHYILKPFAPATLRRCIDRVMSRGR